MNDPVSDLLLRIKNAVSRKKEAVDIPASALKERIVKVLAEEGFLARYETLTRGSRKILRIVLKYCPDKYGKPSIPVVRELKQISKPGRRVYVPASKIPRIQGDFGVSILSTPQGIMTGEGARAKRIGGEVLVYAY